MNPGRCCRCPRVCRAIVQMFPGSKWRMCRRCAQLFGSFRGVEVLATWRDRRAFAGDRQLQHVAYGAR